MTTIEIQLEGKDKIIKRLEKAYEKLLEFKKMKNSDDDFTLRVKLA